VPSEIFHVVVDGDALERRLHSAGRLVADLAPTFAVVAEDLVAAVVDRFDSNGDGTWEPNKPSTIRKKGSAKPMEDDGVLKGSILPESGADWAAAATNVSYIVYSLEGGDIIPKRNPFEIGDDVIDEASRFVAEAVALAVTRAA
jgi:phage gpG-like protein